MLCFYHDLDGAPRSAVTTCERYMCGRGLCADCNYQGRCYEHVLASFNADYKIAMGRKIRVWAFTILVTVGLTAALIANLSPQEGYGVYQPGASPATLLFIPFIAVGAWFFYMGVSWIYEKMRGTGYGVGVGYVSSGLRPANMQAATSSVLSMIFVAFVIVILFLIVSWPIIIIGLVTGITKYKLDNKVIRAYRAGPQALFPDKYMPLRYRSQPLPEPA